MKRRAAIAIALGLILSGLVRSASADPMRPLVLPPSAAAASASASAAASAGAPGSAAPAPGSERSARPAETLATRELARLVAIRHESGQGWQALLGERWLRVGDKLEKLDKVTVGAIDANTVELVEGRQRRTLTLLPALKRTPPAAAAGTDVAQAAVPSAGPFNRASALPTP